MAKRKIALSNKPKSSEITPSGYKAFIAGLKNKIRSSQVEAAISVNRELIRLYWSIGKDISEKQEKDKWGAGIIEKVARDMQNEFPGIEGFSPRNVWRMRAFYRAYVGASEILPQLVAELGETAFLCV